MKKTLLLALLIAAAVLSARSQTATYKVYAIRFAGTRYPFTVADWAKDGPTKESVKINFMVWMIRGNGRNILVDAGFLNNIDKARDFKITGYTRPDSALLKLDLKAGDVTDIILSHPHWDHIDGVGLF